MAEINATVKYVKPIMIYGHSVLRKNCTDIIGPLPELNVLAESLWQTLEYSGGVGLAAPQINESLTVFIVNSRLMYTELTESSRNMLFSGDEGIAETFINASIIAESEETWKEPEGCLSIPGINENVERAREIILEYRDTHFDLHRKQFSGYTAKVIQHELDHTQGILFIDHLPALTKRVLLKKLKRIREGKQETVYPAHYVK
jgi:peptide deformylase